MTIHTELMDEHPWTGLSESDLEEAFWLRNGVWRAGDMDLLAEAARRFVENEQANSAFHEGYKAGYQDGCVGGPLGVEYMGRGFNGVTTGKIWRRHVSDWEEVE